MSENPSPMPQEQPQPLKPPSLDTTPTPKPSAADNRVAAQESHPAASPLARDTHEQDLLGMGRTAGQRTAEVFAGLRGELMRSPETNALSHMTGRITARLIMATGSKKALNFVPVRHGAFAGLIKQALGSDVSGKVLVEIAAGFSPRGIALAKEMPNLQVIEIDLPDVIAEKQKRLNRGQIQIPPNITWKTADLGVQPLSDVLEQQRVDVVSAEGLLPYFTLTEIIRIARQIRSSLKLGGVFIADLGFTDPKGAQETGRLVKIFQRYTSSAPGYVSEEDTAYRLFQEAGYDPVELYHTEQAAALFDLPRPVSEVLYFMVAHRNSD